MPDYATEQSANELKQAYRQRILQALQDLADETDAATYAQFSEQTKGLLNDNPTLDTLRQAAMVLLDPEAEDLTQSMADRLDQHVLDWHNGNLQRQQEQRALQADAYRHYLADQMGLTRNEGNSVYDYDEERYRNVMDLKAQTTLEDLRNYTTDNFFSDDVDKQQLDEQIMEWYLHDGGIDLTVPDLDKEIETYQTFLAENQPAETPSDLNDEALGLEEAFLEAARREQEAREAREAQERAVQERIRQEQLQHEQQLDHARRHYQEEHPDSYEDAVYQDDGAVMDWYEEQVQTTRNAYLDAISHRPAAEYSRLRDQAEAMDSEGIWTNYYDAYVKQPALEQAAEASRREQERAEQQRRHDEEVRKANQEYTDNARRHYREEHPDGYEDKVYQDNEAVVDWFHGELNRSMDAYLLAKGVTEADMAFERSKIKEANGVEAIWKNYYLPYVKKPAQQKEQQTAQEAAGEKEAAVEFAKPSPPTQETPEEMGGHVLSGLMDHEPEPTEEEDELAGPSLADVLAQQREKDLADGKEPEPVFVPIQYRTPEFDEPAAPDIHQAPPQPKEPVINISDPPAANEPQSDGPIPQVYTPQIEVEQPAVDEPEKAMENPPVPEMEETPKAEEKLPELEKVEPRRRSYSFSAPRPNISPDKEPPQVEEPKAEEFKAEEPKTEELKVEEPGVEKYQLSTPKIYAQSEERFKAAEVPEAEQPPRPINAAAYQQAIHQLRDNLKETLSFFSSDSQEFKTMMGYVNAVSDLKNMDERQLREAFHAIKGGVDAYRDHNKADPRPGNWRRQTRMGIMDKMYDLATDFEKRVYDPKAQLLEEATKAMVHSLPKTVQAKYSEETLQDQLTQMPAYKHTMKNLSPYDLQNIADGKKPGKVLEIYDLQDKWNKQAQKAPTPENLQKVSSIQANLP